MSQFDCFLQQSRSHEVALTFLISQNYFHIFSQNILMNLFRKHQLPFKKKCMQIRIVLNFAQYYVISMNIRATGHLNHPKSALVSMYSFTCYL